VESNMPPYYSAEGSQPMENMLGFDTEINSSYL